MQFFSFNVTYVVVDNNTGSFESGELPFTVNGISYEEARTKALDFAQSISRCYNDSDFEDFYFRITSM